MRNDCSKLEELRNEVMSGKITDTDIQKRLSAAIEAEYLKPQPDAEFISLCEDMLWHIGTQGEQPLPSSTDRYLTLIERHTKPERPERDRDSRFKRLAVVLTVLVLIVAFSGGAIHFRWFTQFSSPDEQQHVIMGHEVTVEMVASAIADHTSKEPIVVSDFSEFEKHLGFDPRIPSVLGDEWLADYGALHFVSGYVKITARYVHREDENRNMNCTVNYYDDIDFAYFSFEQNREGTMIKHNNFDLYVSDNMDRATACWYNENMYVWLSGNMNTNEIVSVTSELIGGMDHEKE